ncbi:hypothetical protein HB830_02480 [Listeria innocua]|uniref:hypothetical protein n=1 Tax=Listeria innocua TaxID=1642 RepID=UPI001626C822|nr:hypothetical protein [Listeria innocua]MBC1392251.1 hypothetical protein [Listeria innocua]
MYNKITKFIENWEKDNRIIEEHIDFFISSKDSFSFLDVYELINAINEVISKKQLNVDLDVIAYIECGSSQNIQIWGNDFWKLVDNSLTPASIVLGEKIEWQRHDYQKKISCNLSEKQDYENIYTCDYDGELFTRRLHIVKKGMYK